MGGEPVATRVHILDREYAVRCRPEEQTVLRESARYLTEKMAEAKSSGRALSHDRIAIMTALNITSEYLKLRQEKDALEAALAEDIHRIATKLASSSAQRSTPSPPDRATAFCSDRGQAEGS